MSALSFEIEHEDATSDARVGSVTTPHGRFETPAFMPVGTQATIKGMLPEQVRDLGAEIILANTYHLLLRPGSELVEQMGGLQRWMGWHGPILTDSGGYQVFSLAHISRLDDEGVTFQSHIDGATVALTPERAMQVQHQLGADIIMALDDCPPGSEGAPGGEPGRVATDDADDAGEADAAPGGGAPSRLAAARDPGQRGVREPEQGGDRDGAASAGRYLERVREANERTLNWLERCVAAHRASGRSGEQALFGIVQGGTDLEQRTWCARRVTGYDLPGYAIGGVAVGEGPAQMKRVVEHTAGLLPRGRPRYLMGVGYERDLVMAVRAGVDMFDCVLPTRNGRNANAFTATGQLRLKNARFRDDPRPIEPGCDCLACGGGGGGAGEEAGSWLEAGPAGGEGPAGFFSRSYLRHLFQAGEILGPVLVSAHNLRHFQRLMLDIRAAIRKNDWSWTVRRWPVLRDAVPA